MGQQREGLAAGLAFSGDASFSAVRLFVLELSTQQDTGREGEQGESV